MLAEYDSVKTRPRPENRACAADAKPRVLMYDVDIEHMRSCERVQSASEIRGHGATVELTRICRGTRDLNADIAEHRPDFILFAGLPERPVKLPVINNADAHPEIPRIGLHTSDIFAPMWWANYQRFQTLGVHGMFSPHSCPSVDRYENAKIPVYYLPRMVNSDLFHDYGEEKLFHVGFFGTGFRSHVALYAWRKRIAAALDEKFVTISTGRPDVLDQDDPLIPYGERYARLINRCYFAPACSTTIRRPVEKALQIPASMSCLVTEGNTLLEEYGFRDMVNCVVADESDIADKLRGLMADRKELNKITKAGYRLVHDNYLGAQMRAMRNWYEAFAEMPPGGKVCQTGVLDFEAVAPGGAPTRELRGDENPAHATMARAFDQLLAGETANAGAAFFRAMSFQNFFTPANIGYAIVKLYQGDLSTAMNHLRPNIVWLETMAQGHLDNDPALVAYFALMSILNNNQESAEQALGLARGRRHPLLQSVRLITSVRRDPKNVDVNADTLEDFINGGQDCESECPLNFGTAHGYLEHFLEILSANGQKGLCRRIERLL